MPSTLQKHFCPSQRNRPKERVYLFVVFEGALNVQNVAQLLVEHYPTVTDQTGIEHTMSLSFGHLYHIGSTLLFASLQSWLLRYFWFQK